MLVSIALFLLGIAMIIAAFVIEKTDAISRVSFFLTGLFFSAASAAFIWKTIENKVDKDITEAFSKLPEKF